MEKALKIIRSIAFMILGIASILCGTKIGGDYDCGDYIDEYTYGGDAYTGIQNAIAKTGTNVRYQTHLLRDVFCYTFILSGCVLIVVGVTSIPCKRKEESEE